MKKEYSTYQLVWLFPLVLIIQILFLIITISDINVILSLSPIIMVLSICMLIVLPLALLIYSIVFGMKKITFTDTYLRVSLFKVFNKKVIIWSNLFEVKIIKHDLGAFGWICFSEVSLDGYSYTDIIKSKNVVIIQDTNRNRRIASEYCDLKID